MKTVIVALILSLSGCAAVDQVLDKGAEINDKALNKAEFTICKGASVGSVRRHFGEAERAKLWVEFCNSDDAFTPKN